jgi:hypothetical protein
VSGGKVGKVAVCEHCGLTFPGGKRIYSTWGHPVVSFEAHLAHHEREEARQEELEARAARINALPGVLDHLPEDECAQLDGQAESDVSVRLPVWAASRTTGTKPPLGLKGVEMVDVYELPVPTDEELATHARKFGGEGVYTLSREEPTDGRARRSVERDLRERGRKRSRRRVGVKEELRDLMWRKPQLLPSVAADVLNISDRRVKTLLAELRSEGALTG